MEIEMKYLGLSPEGRHQWRYKGVAISLDDGAVYPKLITTQGVANVVLFNKIG